MITLMAAVSLTMTATGYSASTKITALPFNIATPGTYQLTGDLSFPSVVGTPAISISGGLPGPVVLDLNGFAIMGDVTPGSYCIIVGGAPVSSPITIKNGTIQNFNYGIYANNLTNLTVNKIYFMINILRPFAQSSPTGIEFQTVSSSTISNCVFTNYYYNAAIAISDTNSNGGNRYSNDSFVDVVTPLAISIAQSPKPSFLIKDCKFDAPSTP
jgi:hypothetical protein